MKLSFRRAKAEDEREAIPLIYSSGPEIFDYVFATDAKSALEFMRYEFITGRGFLGHRNHLVVLNDNNVVGIGAFYSGAEYNHLMFGSIRNVLAFYGLFQSISVLKRSMHVKSIMPPPDRSTLYIANLGVAPLYRGRGVGTALLEHWKLYAKENSFKVYALDVMAHNTRAQKLYTRLGFHVSKVNHFCSNKTHPVLPDTLRMKIIL